MLSSVSTPVMSSRLPSSSTRGLLCASRRVAGDCTGRCRRASPGYAVPAMMVHLYDYAVPIADPDAGVPSLRAVLADLGADDRKALLSGLFRPERMPGTMERLSTLVANVDASFADLLPLLDNSARVRRSV